MLNKASFVEIERIKEQLNVPKIEEIISFVSSISPTEYEIKCKEVLMQYAEQEGLKDFTIQHDTIIQSDDGEYQIDIFASFIAMGVGFKVLAECKRYSNPITREKVVLLADKVKQLGAHKGILISTSGFQSGAYRYAKKHGIALLQITDTSTGLVVVPHNIFG